MKLIDAPYIAICKLFWGLDVDIDSKPAISKSHQLLRAHGVCARVRTSACICVCIWWQFKQNS